MSHVRQLLVAYLCIRMGNSSRSMTMSLSATSTGEMLAASTLSIFERKKGALFGLYAADATAMPVHWMYDLNQLRRDYGVISHYVAPKDRFDGSIMNLSNTGGIVFSPSASQLLKLLY